MLSIRRNDKGVGRKGEGRRVCTDSYHLTNRRHSCRRSGQAHKTDCTPTPCS